MQFALDVQAITRRFDARVAVDALSFRLQQGEVFGFLGPNGAGKTTTVRMLSALIAPSEGTALVNGYDLSHQQEEIRQSVGILTETPGLYDRLSAWQNLIFFARLYGLTPQRAASQAEHYLRLFDLWERRDDRVGGFSKGMRQKLAIARTLLHEPELVFFDEPTAGLDPEAARMVRNAIKDLRQGGRTVFLTTHNLAEADELCDIIGVFKTRLLHMGSPEQLRAQLYGQGTSIRVTGEAARWLETLEKLPFVSQVTATEDQLLVQLTETEQHTPEVVATLVQVGAAILEVTPLRHSLEDVYLELLNEDKHEAIIGAEGAKHE